MINLRAAPIQRKLRFVILGTCTAALCVASGALFALQYFFFQRDYRRDLEAVAEMVCSISAPAISLGGIESTRTILKALQAKPHITGALILMNDGSTAANLGTAEEKLQKQRPGSDGFHKVGGDLMYVHPILSEGTRIGTLYLISDYRKRSIRLHALYASILIAVLASSFLVAVVVSSRLERLISGPIQTLADTARRIAAKSDYSLRARKEADDEVGDFTDTFNGMLSQIQERDFALRRVHQQLVDASRAAGMAEVATDVLHNVGNVLNSVNVSATLISEKLKNPRTSNFARAATILRDQNGSLAKFLAEDPKGRLIPSYLVDAAGQLERDQAEALAELELLARNIGHIKEIVALQQSNARVLDFVAPMALDLLIEEAVRMNAAALERNQVRVVRSFADVPAAAVDKHKVLQIVVNLLCNSIYAMDEGGTGEKILTIRLRSHGPGMLAIEVSDTGVGIPEENLTRIFSHGFTTREEGHGFGLHSAALAAKDMGGSLRASSPGPNQGATFTLLLPTAPAPCTPASEQAAPLLHA